jgi:hypothetical protein
MTEIVTVENLVDALRTVKEFMARNGYIIKTYDSFDQDSYYYYRWCRIWSTQYIEMGGVVKTDEYNGLTGNYDSNNIFSISFEMNDYTRIRMRDAYYQIFITPYQDQYPELISSPVIVLKNEDLFNVEFPMTPNVSEIPKQFDWHVVGYIADEQVFE